MAIYFGVMLNKDCKETSKNQLKSIYNLIQESDEQLIGFKCQDKSIFGIEVSKEDYFNNKTQDVFDKYYKLVKSVVFKVDEEYLLENADIIIT